VLELLFARNNRPSWSWSWAATGALGPGQALTRGSAARYANSAGTLVSASTDVARFAYDPYTLQRLGLAVSRQATNSALRSTDITAAPWTNFSASRSATGGGTAPDGTATCNALSAGAANAEHLAQQALTIPSDTWTGLSSFFKSLTTGVHAYLSLSNDSSKYATAFIDLANGVSSQSAAVGGNISDISVQRWQNNLWRLQFNAKITAANPMLTIGTCLAASGNTINADGYVSHLGTGTEGIGIWNPQAEIGNGTTMPIVTAGSSVTVAQDIVTVDPAAVTGFRQGGGGMFVVTYRLMTVDRLKAQPLLQCDDGGTGIIYMSANEGAGTMASYLSTGAGVSPNMAGGASPAPWVRRRQAFFYGPSQGGIARDGAIDTLASGAYPVPSGLATFRVGRSGSDSGDAIFERIDFFPGVRSPAQAIGATA
jgi:hypothetical protein